MSGDSSRPSANKDSPAKGKLSFAVWAAIVISLAAGLGLWFSPPDIQNWGLAILGLLCTTLGAFQSGLGAVTYRRTRQRLLSVLSSVMCLLLLILAILPLASLLALIEQINAG